MSLSKLALASSSGSSDGSSGNTESTGKLLLKEAIKLGVGCGIGFLFGYIVCNYKWYKYNLSNELKEDLCNNMDVEEYIRREGNVYIKQLSDIRLTTMKKYPKKIKYLSPVSQCHFLKWIVSTTNVRKGIQIGVFTGSSALCIGLGIKQVRDRDNRFENIVNDPSLFNTSPNNSNQNMQYKLICINDSHPDSDKFSGSFDLSNNNRNKRDNLDDLAADITLDIGNDDNNNNKNNENTNYDEEIAISERAWKDANVSDIISSEYCHEPYKTENALSILSTLYANRENHSSFDFAYINNIADLASLKEYYTLLMKLVKTNGIICINNTLFDGKVATQFSNKNNNNNNNANSKNNKNNSNSKNDRNNNNRNIGRNKLDGSNNMAARMDLSMSHMLDGVPENGEYYGENEILDTIRSFNHKIVSDSTDKLLIDCCMILMSNNHSMTLIRKLNRNVNESNSNLMQRHQK